MIEIDKRKIEIYDFTINNFSSPYVEFQIRCSKGTYIRVLGKNIAQKLGTVGHLKSLVRTQVGGFSIDESQSIQLFEASWKSSNIYINSNH